jgi:uncharacterized membrane protein
MSKALRIFSLGKRQAAPRPKRIFEIDLLRGLAVLLMILFHLAYLFSAIPDFFVKPASGSVEWVSNLTKFGGEIWESYYDNGALKTLQIVFSGLFMLLCGISCTFAKSNFKRGIELGYVSVLLTIILDAGSTYIPGLEVQIFMGILHVMTIGILIYALVDHFFPSVYADLGMAAFFIVLTGAFTRFDEVSGPMGLTWITYQSHRLDGVLTYEAYSYAGDVSYSLTGTNLVTVMDKAFLNNLGNVILGRVGIGDDCFPPFVTCAAVFLGASIGKTTYAKRKSVLPETTPTRLAAPVIFLGKHSLAFYILHMPLLLLLLALVLSFAGYRLF